jgi:hypothetical protein
MRHKWSSNTVFCVVAATLAGPLYAQSATAKSDGADPCDQVVTACKSAGYEEGKGLWYDCVDPILHGGKATEKKPDVSPQVISACHTKDPTFPRKPKAKSDAADPCDQVVTACKSAGYEEGESKEGKGLWYDCVDPILHGRKATEKKPDVSPQVISACHTKDPTFPGKPKAKPKE